MLVEGQGKVFLAILAIGGLAGFLYDVYRVIRLRGPALRGPGAALADLVFSGVAAVVVFLLLVKANHGELRLYVLLGLLAGALLYSGLVSRFAFRLVDFVLHLASKLENLFFVLLGSLLRALLFPLRKTLVIIWWPLKLSYSGSRYAGHATMAEMKRRGAGCLSSCRVRMGNWKHLIGRDRRD